MRDCLLLASAAGSMLVASAHSAIAQLVRYDFAQVTQICSDAIAGQNVATPVPGFELRLLKDGRPVYHRTFGNWSLNRVAAADSSTKTIAGALIMSVIDTNQNLVPGSGQFTLNTTVGSYYSRLAPDVSGITIRQLFSHTSGIGPQNFAQSQTFNSAISSTTLSLQQAAQVMLGIPLANVPGTAFSYGGNSMHVAGAIVERASGQAWNTLYTARLAGPLGLTATRFVLSSPTNPRIAGGCESTATEFGVLMEMLRRGGLHSSTPGSPATRVLSQASVDAMFTRQSPNPVILLNSPVPGVSDYGVGVWLDQRNQSGTLIGALAAGARGFASWIDFDDGMVGVFGTDTTGASNVLPVYTLLRAAAEQAIRNPLPCVADFDADGTLGVIDIFAYLNAFFASHPAADIDGGGLNTSDIFAFLNLWFAGCSEA